MARMDDTEDDARYPPNPYHSNHNSRSSFPSSNRSKVPHRSAALSPQIDRRYPKDEEEDESDAEEDELNGGGRAMEDDVEEDEEDDEEDGRGSGYRRPHAEESSPESRGKRRKLNKFALGFEFAPRVAAPAPVVASATATSSRPPVRNNPADWTEDSTFVLLDAWGVLYIQNGRKSLRSDEWMEVAKKVNESSRTPRTDAQCRNRLDTLKKKYKKEKARMAESMSSSSKWVYFKKMEELMGSPSPPQAPRQQQQLRLPCGIDSGEYVFANSRHYLNRSNGLDEMRDSPAGSELMGDDEDDDESDGLPPQSTKKPRGGSDSSSFRMLADSIQKFSEIYEKMENSKRQHMAELEKMRREFHRDLEVQKRQILERAHEELDKIRQEEGDDEEDEEEADEGEEENNDNDDIDGSAENASS